jgi:Fe2+ or Zn2+ uptake regulation protein
VAQKQPNPVIETAAAIERYLASRPQAAETVEGIAHWWLVRQRYDDSVDMVQRALDLLVERGVVERLALSGGQPMYRKAPDAPRAL